MAVWFVYLMDQTFVETLHGPHKMNLTALIFPNTLVYDSVSAVLCV